MPRALRGLIALAVAFAAIGPVAGLLVGSLRGEDGGTHATLLVGQSPIIGLISGILAFAFAAGAGAIGSKAAGLNVGFVCAGLVLSWAAWLSGRLDTIVAVTRESPLQPLILEGVVVAALIGGIAWVVRRFSIDDPDTETEAGLTGVLVALVAGLALSGTAAWVIAIEPLKGQTIGAAFVAGIIGAASARLVFLRLPGWTVVAIPAVLAVLGPLSAQVLAGDVVDAVYDRTLFRLGWLTPLDWAAGALVGIPIGLAWTDNVVQQQHDRADSQPPSI